MKQPDDSPPMMNSLPLAIISDFNAQPLAQYLRHDLGAPVIAPHVAPMGPVVASLARAAELVPSAQSEPWLWIWSRPEAVSANFARLQLGETSDADGDADAALAEVDAFAAAIADAAASAPYIWVVQWRCDDTGFVLLDNHWSGARTTVQRMNLRLHERLRRHNNVFIVDPTLWLTHGGGSSAKMWYLAKVPFAPQVFAAAARDCKAMAAGLLGQRRKVIVCDLDDTLWGGTLGDVGWEHLALGGHHPAGEAYLDLQRALLTCKRRGVMLAILSKNDERTALHAIDSHPEMLLRSRDLSGWVINWQDKAQNLLTLVQRLNVGLSAVLFIDDNPVERARIRDAFPEVTVLDLPADPLLYASTLRQAHCFEIATLTREDLERTESIQSESARQAARRTVGSAQAWLSTLQLCITVAPLTRADLPRAAQLLNKTNQMNLTTRRLSEQELWRWHEGADHHVWTLRVRDKFGDSGLVGLVSLHIDGPQAHVVDFVLSCRVFGRQVEDIMVNVLADAARAAGCPTVQAQWIPTEKNAPCLQFLQGSAQPGAAPNLFVWPAAPRPTPTGVRVEVITRENV